MILQKTEVMLCVCLFCFIWETGLFVLYFCLMNNCSDGSDEVSFFFFFSGRFFKLNGDLPAIYCDKNPQVVFILFFSARSNFLFLECYAAALWRFFFLPAQCTWKCFVFSSSIPELPKTEVQYSKPEMTYMTFLQMNSSAGLRSDSEFI